MIGINKILSVIICALACTVSFSQQLDTTAVRFLDYHAASPFEKVYLRTDKEIYTRGETLWFSAHVVDAGEHTPSILSSLLYVDLINPGDTIVSTLHLKIVEGRGNGDFFIADSLAEGIFHLRGYTNYMKNFEEGFQFNKPIKILDFSSRTESTPPPEEVADVSVKFFPEGGNLVAGQLNYVAFRAVNENGNGITISGKIIDNQQNAVSEFSDDLFGMGKFQLTPQKGIKYFAVFNVGNVEFSEELPEVQDTGFIFNVRQNSTKIYLTIKPSEGESMEDGFVIGHSRGVLFAMLPAKTGQPFIYAPLPVNQLPSGICHFTFFDGNGNPRAERLVFNDNPDMVTESKVTSNKDQVKKREKIKLSIDLGEEVISGNTSIAVLSDNLNKPNIINIENYLMLSSDLKGQIQHPEIYFDRENENRFKYLDLIMMTNGWRRFKWEDVLNQDLPPVTFFPEKGFSIEGQVVNYVNRKKGVRGKVELSFLENIEFKAEATSEENGIFWFDGLQIEDTLTTIIKTQKLKEGSKGEFKEAKGGTFISLKEKIPPPTFAKFLNPYAEDQAFMEYIDQSQKIRNIEAEFGNDVIILDAFEINTRRDILQDYYYSKTQLYREPDTRLIMDSISGSERYTNLVDMIRGRVSGIQVSGSFPNYKITGRGVDAVVVLDGIPSDITAILNVQVQQVEFIDVLRIGKASLYGGIGGSPVIAIYRRLGPGGIPIGGPDPVDMITFMMNGYYPPREFYVPDYDTLSRDEAVKPDFRTTLYWNPNVSIIEGRVEVEFFVSDESGSFTAYLEGLSEDGRIILSDGKFSVR